MEAIPSQLTLIVDTGRGADDEDRAELTRRLRHQLLAADVDAVKSAKPGGLPEGAKGDPTSLFTLVVSIAPAAVTAIINTLQVWLSRHDHASVTIESGGEKLSLNGALSEDQKRLVEAFLDRHKAPVASDG